MLIAGSIENDDNTIAIIAALQPAHKSDLLRHDV